jgi:hypothetical protein
MTDRATSMSHDDRWGGLQTLIWARLLVAALALPFGVLLRPSPPLASWRLLGVALATVGVLSAIFWLGATLQRGFLLQVYLQLAADLLLVTGMAALTGGAQSPFALLYVLRSSPVVCKLASTAPWWSPREPAPGCSPPPAGGL